MHKPRKAEWEARSFPQKVCAVGVMERLPTEHRVNGKSSEEGLVTTWLFWVLVLQKRQIVLVSFSPKSKPSAAGFAMRKPKLLHWKQLPKITAGVTKHTLAWFYLPPTYQYRILKPM